MKAPIREGIVVISQKGRDKGRLFVVLYQVDADFVLIADGDARKVEKPKRKRRKHLASTRWEFPDLAEAFSQKRLMDSDLRKALKQLFPPVSDAAKKEDSLFGQK